MNPFDRFQKNLGYVFQDHALLSLALTHRSCGSQNNERLEFLGDSVLDAVISKALYQQFPYSPEGELSQMRSRLVRGQTLATIARRLDIKTVLSVGVGQAKSGLHDRDSILGNTIEAVVGAIYLDSDFETVTNCILLLYKDRLSNISSEGIKDSKSRLQELLHKRNQALPVYRITEQSGEPHRPVFTASCALSESGDLFIGTGHNRKQAEQCAADKAIAFLSE